MDDNKQISINDLVVVKDLIDVACSRGAFQAAEMQTIGEVYNKITAFIDAVVAAAQANAEADAAIAQNPQGDSQ